MADLKGVVPVIPAPFDEAGELDLDAVGPLVEFAVAGGVGAACLPAYGSEFYKLTDDERVDLVSAAVDAAAGRIDIIGQANHPGANIAAQIAQRMQAAGADHIGLALPRIFALREEDLLRYSSTVCDAVDIPILIQDFNPGGATVGASYCVQLKERCPNFEHIKLEEAMMGTKMESIHQATDLTVKVLEGWGGLYMLELVPRGCVGIMPDLGLCDALQRIFEDLVGKRGKEAFALFAELTPYLNFSLQSMELYHHAEKRLLLGRGALRCGMVRDATVYPDASSEAYLEFLLERMWETLERFGFARRPLA